MLPLCHSYIHLVILSTNHGSSAKQKIMQVIFISDWRKKWYLWLHLCLEFMLTGAIKQKNICLSEDSAQLNTSFIREDHWMIRTVWAAKSVSNTNNHSITMWQQKHLGMNSTSSLDVQDLQQHTSSGCNSTPHHSRQAKTGISDFELCAVPTNCTWKQFSYHTSDVKYQTCDFFWGEPELPIISSWVKDKIFYLKKIINDYSTEIPASSIF